MGSVIGADDLGRNPSAVGNLVSGGFRPLGRPSSAVTRKLAAIPPVRDHKLAHCPQRYWPRALGEVDVDETAGIQPYEIPENTTPLINPLG